MYKFKKNLDAEKKFLIDKTKQINYYNYKTFFTKH